MNATTVLDLLIAMQVKNYGNTPLQQVRYANVNKMNLEYIEYCNSIRDQECSGEG